MEQILNISSNGGYWSSIKDCNIFTVYIETCLGTFNSNRNEILNINSSTYIPTEGDKIFFMPEVNIPRIKFKNIAFEKKIKAVRDVEKANIIIANEASLYKITTKKSNYIVTTEKFKELLKKPDCINKLDLKDIEALNTALEFYTGDIIIVDRFLANACTENQDFTDDLKYASILIIDSEYNNIIEQCKDKLIFNESGLVDLLNGEAASIIDAEMFKQLSNMFESSDQDNHILAMEIMANCKYTVSLAYMLLLFKDYNNQMSNCHTRNHVNFKALTSWLHKDILYRNDLDVLCNILKEKNQFTSDNLNILLNHSHADILNRGETNYFSIKVITLNPEHAIPGYDYTVISETEDNFDEAIENAIDLIEPIEVVEEIIEETIISESELNKSEKESEIIEVTTEKNIVHDLYSVDNDDIEIVLPVETVSNNHQIEKNESDDFEWF